MIQLLNHREPDMANAIHQLSLNAYRVEADFLGVDLFPPLNEKIASILNSHSQFYGCYMDSLLAGVMELEGDVEKSVNRLVVDPLFFRRGIATRLLDAGKAMGKTLRVSTAKANTPAVRLYQQSGFRLIDTFLIDDAIHIVVFECRP